MASVRYRLHRAPLRGGGQTAFTGANDGVPQRRSDSEQCRIDRPDFVAGTSTLQAPAGKAAYLSPGPWEPGALSQHLAARTGPNWKEGVHIWQRATGSLYRDVRT